MNDPNNHCIFCNIKKEKIIFNNELAVSSFDSYPVSKHHALIFPKRHMKDYFDLNDKEVFACNQLIKLLKNLILKLDPSVKGFNIGSNAGKISGQSVMHCHIHLIPRRQGDVKNPQGGVRGVIPSKQHYVRKSNK